MSGQKIRRHAFVSALLLLCSSLAHADLKCELGDSSGTLLDLGGAAAQLKITPSTPIGTTLFSQTFTGLTAKCSLTTATGSSETAYFVRPNLAAALGSNGLSLYVTYNSNRNNTAVNLSTGTVVTNRSAFLGLPSSSWQSVSLGPVTIEVVKTGATTATSPTGISANIIAFSVGSTLKGGDKANYFLRGANGIVYQTETCKVNTPANFEVQLGSVAVSSKSGFGSGTGSTSTATNFNIGLTCDTAVSGKFDIMLQLDGTAVSGLASSGVLALTAGGATGLGVQVRKGDDTTVAFATPWKIGSYPATSSTLTLPFSARYYQTQAKVTPGAANSSMTYTLSYQ